MGAKVIAIGNSVMGDDGIALLVAERLRERLLTLEIPVVIGETDLGYCLGEIDSKDYLFILDATNYGFVPGTVTIMNLDQIAFSVHQSYTQHQLNLVHLLQMIPADLSGSVIGIEAARVMISNEISPELKTNLNHTIEKVYRYILLKLFLRIQND